MGYVFRRSESGIVHVEESMEAAALERALRSRSPDLRLQGWPDVRHDCILWKVVLQRPDHPPDTVCVWQDERGEPLPLSSGLLDLVDRLDKNSRGAYLNEDQRNAAARVKVEKKAEADQEALVEDWSMKHGRPILPRSQKLRQSRDKRRARGEKI